MTARTPEDAIGPPRANTPGERALAQAYIRSHSMPEVAQELLEILGLRELEFG